MQARQLVFGLVIVLLMVSRSSYAEQILVDSVSYNTSVDKYKLIFAVSDSPRHRVFVLDNPSRLVIDIKNAQVPRLLVQPSSGHPVLGNYVPPLKMLPIYVLLLS